MSDKICRQCGKLLENGDQVQAMIVTYYIGLKSKLHYSLEKPTACLWIEHYYCDHPKGDQID